MWHSKHLLKIPSPLQHIEIICSIKRKKIHISLFYLFSICISSQCTFCLPLHPSGARCLGSLAGCLPLGFGQQKSPTGEEGGRREDRTFPPCPLSASGLPFPASGYFLSNTASTWRPLPRSDSSPGLQWWHFQPCSFRTRRGNSWLLFLVSSHLLAFFIPVHISINSPSIKISWI